MRAAICICAAVLAGLVLPAVASAAGVNITVVEGTSFTKRVADTGGCTLASAAVTWGDGTADSPGDPTDDGTGIQGTHKYAEEGSYNGSVHYTCNNFGGIFSATFVATVQDAPLTAAGRDSSGQAGQSLTAVVAHFDDANPDASADQFTAQINWGDGTTSPGTTGIAVGGGFNVTGTHTYTTASSYTVTTTINDTPSNTATTTSTARIGAPPPPTTPQAQFTFDPRTPCRDDNVSFDASSSFGSQVPLSKDRLPIKRYRWLIDDRIGRLGGHEPYAPVVNKDPAFTQAFPAAYFTIEPYSGHKSPPLTAFYFDYRFFRPPLDVTLEVTDSAGETALTTHRISFANPDETRQLSIGEWYGEPEFFTVQHYQYLDTADLGGTFKPCDSRTPAQKAGSAALASDRAQLSPFHTLFLKGDSRIGVKSNCHWKRGVCLGELVVRESGLAGGARAARKKRLGRVLARTAFFINAGKTKQVVLRLNARGRKLARAHRLRKVVLQLKTVAHQRKVITTKRTVRVRSRR
ncbi:MAG: large repetitive protein [Thermoleophilaceae bacterium]|nr:large repetitive protein [Thermoleophilaceae bacterium]